MLKIYRIGNFVGVNTGEVTTYYNDGSIMLSEEDGKLLIINRDKDEVIFKGLASSVADANGDAYGADIESVVTALSTIANFSVSGGGGGGGDASAANQLTEIAQLQSVNINLAAVLAELRDDVLVLATLWEDESGASPVFYREERIRSQDDGSISTVYTRLSDNVQVVSLPAGSKPVQASSDRDIQFHKWKASANGAGYSIGDWLSNTIIFTVGGVGSVLSSSWYNLSTSADISAPPNAHLQDPNDKINEALGAKDDAQASSDTGSFSLIAFVKRILTFLTSGLANWNTILARLPASLGKKSDTASLSVTLANNEKPTIIFDMANLSPFGDLVANGHEAVVQMSFVYGINTQLATTSVANVGVADTNNGRLRLQSGTNSAGSAVCRSVRPAKYRAGVGVTARFTCVFDAGVANNKRAVGVGGGTSLDGYFFGFNGAVFGIFHYNRGVETFIAQASWNTDKCDGTGTSGFNWDKTKGNVCQIMYPYLGYGNVNFFVQDNSTGRFILCHQIKYTNTSAETQLGNPDLFFYTFNTNAGNTTNVALYVGSVGVFLNGTRQFLGVQYGTDNNKALTATVLTNIFTIKNCINFNGAENRGQVRIDFVTYSSGNLGNNNFATFRFIKNATLAGTPTFSPIAGSTADNGATITNGSSMVSVDTAGTNVTGGVAFKPVTLPTNQQCNLDLQDKRVYLAPGETLTLACVVTAAGSCAGGFDWTEE